MATYPDLTKINLNQNIFGGYTNPIAANYGQKLNFIKQYYPQYGSTDARSIDMMYNKAVELTNKYGSSQGNKIGSQLAQTLRTAQAGNVQQQVQQPIQKTQPTTDTSSKKNYSSSSSNYGSSNTNSNTGKNINVPELFNDTGTPVIANNNNVTSSDNNGNVTSGFMNYLSNQNSQLPFSGDWKFPQNQTAPVQQSPNQAIWDRESVFDKTPIIQTGVVTPAVGGAVAGSGSNAVQEAMNLQNTLSNKWGNTSYGDAWTQGNGVLGGISNMWDKFTSPNGSMANPTPSGAENFLKSLGGVGTFAGGVADLMYKSKLADLMGRQVSQQEALQNATLKSKNDWEKSYAGSFK